MFFSFLKSFLYHRHVSRLSPAKVKENQLRQFRALTRYAFEHSVYYRRLITELRLEPHRCTPEDFPVLTKSELMNNFDDIVTDRRISKAALGKYLLEPKETRGLFLGLYHVIHTSGSTGETGYAIYNSAEMARGVTGVALTKQGGLYRKVAFVGATGGAFAGITISSAARHSKLIYRSHTSFDVNMPFGEMVTALNKLQPESLSGYPFALRRLAEAKKSGLLTIRPESIFSGGEALRDMDKNFIQDAFGVPMLNVYASSEFLLMGIGMDQYDGMYLIDSNLIFEFHPNHLCVTNLFNRTLPLIRYQMNDQLQPVTDQTHQLSFTKVANLIGRESVVSTFLTDDDQDEFLSLQVMDELTKKGVDGFQIKILGPRQFLLRVVLNPTAPSDIMTIIQQKMTAFLIAKKMSRVQFEVLPVKSLTANEKTGKFQHVLTKS